jgi:hypothetical protein
VTAKKKKKKKKNRQINMIELDDIDEQDIAHPSGFAEQKLRALTNIPCLMTVRQSSTQLRFLSSTMPNCLPAPHHPSHSFVLRLQNCPLAVMLVCLRTVLP